MKFGDAEPLLIAGYDGLKEDEMAIPEVVHHERMREAIQRLINLAKELNKPDEVKKWQAEAAKYRPLAPMPRETNR
jgi:hypothetical protein